jgi:hypothetical protein
MWTARSRAPAQITARTSTSMGNGRKKKPRLEPTPHGAPPPSPPPAPHYSAAQSASGSERSRRPPAPQPPQPPASRGITPMSIPFLLNSSADPPASSAHQHHERPPPGPRSPAVHHDTSHGGQHAAPPSSHGTAGPSRTGAPPRSRPQPRPTPPGSSAEAFAHADDPRWCLHCNKRFAREFSLTFSSSFVCLRTITVRSLPSDNKRGRPNNFACNLPSFGIQNRGGRFEETVRSLAIHPLVSRSLTLSRSLSLVPCHCRL